MTAISDPVPRLWSRSAQELAQAWGSGPVELHATIESTNDRAKELARTEGRDGAVVLADAQDRGRGRHGRMWASAPGVGLWLSVLRAGEAHPVLTLRVGLALVRALAPWEPESRALQLKWPNDLFVRGRKVGGVLCERLAGYSVVGIGLNVTHGPSDFPAELRGVATSLRQEGWETPDRLELAGAIVAQVAEADVSGVLSATERAEYDQRHALRGRRLRDPQGRIGQAGEVASDGALVLHAEDDTWPVRAGTVFPVED